MTQQANRPLEWRTSWLCACATAAASIGLAAPAARGNISLELHTTTPIVSVGNTFTIDLYGVSTGAPDTTSAGQVILSWNTAFVQLLGTNTSGTPSYLASGFLGDPHGINSSTTDGDAMWIYFAPPGNPLATSASGTLMMRFNFTALSMTTPDTLIDIETSAGSPPGQTIIYDGTIPNTNITGSLSGVAIQVVPGPGGLAMFLGALALAGRRRRGGR
jgi:hypothetical protein